MSLPTRSAPAAAFLLIVLSACSGEVSPTQPSPIPTPDQSSSTTTPGFGAIEGRVTDADTGDPIAGARIDAVSGSTAFSVTTNAAGAFRMDLPPGVARVRATKEGYVTYDREHTIQAGPMPLQIPLAKIVVPPPAPVPTYTLSGLVLDLQGNPVGGVRVEGYRNDSPVDGVVGWTFTDASGRFTLTSTRFPEKVHVGKKIGYQRTTATVAFFPAGSTGNITIVVARYVRYVLVPVSVTVGRTVHVTTRLELDNGASEFRGAEGLTSSNPSVIAVVDRGYI